MSPAEPSSADESSRKRFTLFLIDPQSDDLDEIAARIREQSLAIKARNARNEPESR